MIASNHHAFVNPDSGGLCAIFTFDKGAKGHCSGKYDKKDGH